MPTYIIDTIGRLRHRITIQQPVTSNGIRSWRDVRKVFASISPQSGTEGPSSTLNAPNQTMYRIRFHFLPGVKIRPRMRLRYHVSGQEDRIFEIDAAVDDPDERHQYIDCQCREVTT
jgi:SPP1 family predicted phage head-tail adaptor